MPLAPVVNLGQFTTAEKNFLAHLADLSYSQGDILYYDSGNLTRLAIGSAGKVLTVNAGATAPEWDAVGGTGITIGTTTIASGTNTRILYDNSGVVGEYTLTGTGTAVVMANTPTLITPVLGAATATSITAAAGTAGSPAFTFATGSGGIGLYGSGNSLGIATGSNGNATFAVNGNSVSIMSFSGSNTSATAVFNMGSVSARSGSSAAQVFTSINPTYNQTSTAAATDLLINRIETALGSGAQYLIMAQAGVSGGTEKFSVTNAGLVNATTGYALSGTTVLSGTTLGSTIVTSSLTSVGTIITGVWTGTTIAVANGGTGITSFGSGIATWLGTPTSANLASAITDETGSGALVFGTNPTIAKPVMNARNQTAQTYSPTAAGTATLDLSLGDQHYITMPAGNITIALSNDTNDQIFYVSILQDGTGSRTVTWFTTIRWAGGTPPTLTTTASKRDAFIFVRTGSGTYDGFVVGQNI